MAPLNGALGLSSGRLIAFRFDESDACENAPCTARLTATTRTTTKTAILRFTNDPISTVHLRPPIRIDQTALHFEKHSNRILAPVHSDDRGSNGLHGTAGSERESHNENCIVSLPCSKWLLADYTKANAGIEVYCVLIGLLDFEK